MSGPWPDPAPISLVILPGPGTAATLESVRAQTLPPLEVFLSDPPGPDLDGTHLRSPGGTGPAGFLGAALERARGGWLQVVAGGAVLRPRACELAAGQVRSRPRAGLFLGDAAQAGDGGGQVLPALDWRAAAGIFTGAELAELRSHGPEWPQDAVLLSVARLREAGGFAPDLEWHALWWATHLLGFRHGAAYLRQVLVTGPGPDGPEPASAVWSLEWPVLRALLRRLAAPEQADLLAPLAVSGALGALGPDLGEAYLGQPDLWCEAMSLVLAPCLEAHRRRSPRFLGGAARSLAGAEVDTRLVLELQALIRDMEGTAAGPAQPGTEMAADGSGNG